MEKEKKNKKMNNDNRAVFISYNISTSDEIVRKIAEALEEQGISCFYASRDCEEQTNTDFVIPIVNAIRNCKIFLLMLNKNSNQSEHCYNEVKLIFDRISKHEDIILILYRLDSCKLSPTIDYYLGRAHIMDGSVPPEVVRLNELVNRIIVKLGQEPTFKMSIDEPTLNKKKEYKLIGTIAYPDTEFLGRKKELNQIYEMINGNVNKVFLVGMGGIGKSEIAKKYISEHNEDYAIILWVSFEKSLEQTIINDNKINIQGLSRTEYNAEFDHEYMLRKLNILKQNADKKVLIVIDNFDVTDDPDLEELLSGNYSIIFTTRNHQKNKEIPEINIEPMQGENELLELFKLEYKRQLSSENIEIIKKIIKLLQGHTLSIRLVASAMQSRRISPEKMLDLLENSNEVSDKLKDTTTFIRNKLKEVFNITNLLGEEIVLLKNLSLIPLNGLEVETFYDWCKFDDYDIIDGLSARSWVINDPVTDKAHLHPLISELMQEKLEDNPNDIKNLLEKIYDICLHQIYYNYKEKLEHANIIEYISEHLPESNTMYYEIRFAKALAFSDSAQYAKAKMEFQYSLDNAKTFRDRMRACHYLSQREFLDGNSEKSYEIALKGYEEFKNMDPKKWPEDAGAYCANVLQRLGESLKEMGRVEEAYKFFKMSEEPCHRYYIMSIPHSLGWVNYHLADTLLLMGKLKESEDAINKCLNYFKEINDNWSFGFAHNVLARIYTAKKDFEQALDANKKAIDILTIYEGESNIGKEFEYRADIYHAMGNKENAINNYNLAIELLKKKGAIGQIEKVEEKLKKCY